MMTLLLASPPMVDLNKRSLRQMAFAAVACLMLICCSPVLATEPPRAVRGVLDLTGWDFKTRGIVRLDGQWEFYGQRLVSPEQFKRGAAGPKGFYQVPALWNGGEAGGKPLSAFGYATYRLKVLLGDSGGDLALMQKRMGTAYRLWVDGAVVLENGKVGRSRQEMVPMFLPKIGVFHAHSGAVELVLQVSNFYHKKGGVWNPIELGLAGQIAHKRERALGMDLFLLGSILIMSFYHFVLYWQNRREVSTLYFALFCSCVCLRIMVTGQAVFIRWFPETDWELANRVEYLAYYLSIPAFVMYVKSLFPALIPRMLIRSIQWISALFCLLVLFTQGRIFTHSLIFYQGYTLVVMVTVTALLGKRLFSGQRDIMIFFSGILALGLAGINDILYHNQIIFTGDFLPLGLLGFIFVQSVLLSIRFSQSFVRAERASYERTLAVDANRAKSEFLANMSHELRTPLNAVIGFADIMTRSRTLPEEHRDHAGIISRSGSHLLALINQILDLSKIEAGKVTVTERTFSLHRMLEDLEKLFMAQAGEKGIGLVFRKSDDLPDSLCADEVKLRQILINLLGNAVKFTTQGGVTVSVYLRRAAGSSGTPDPGYRIGFKVEDTGPGIRMQDMEKIFQAFGQTKAGRQAVQGTGLGLPISRKFTRLMGGELVAKSRVGRGSTFMFDIQARAVTDTAPEQKDLRRSITGAIPGQKIRRILIADDGADNRRLLMELLTPLGVEVREAETGTQVVRIWKDWKPNLIFMDIRMPELDGIEATRQIRAARDGGDGPVIVALTASAFEQDRERIMAAGCDDFLAKPFETEWIYDVLGRHLGMAFTYETEEHRPEVRYRPVRETEVEAVGEALSSLPEPVLSELKAAVAGAYFDDAMALVGKIRQRDPWLAERLAGILRQYRFDILEGLFREQEK